MNEMLAKQKPLKKIVHWKNMKIYVPSSCNTNFPHAITGNEQKKNLLSLVTQELLSILFSAICVNLRFPSSFPLAFHNINVWSNKCKLWNVTCSKEEKLIINLNWSKFEHIHMFWEVYKYYGLDMCMPLNSVETCLLGVELVWSWGILKMQRYVKLCWMWGNGSKKKEKDGAFGK